VTFCCIPAEVRRARGASYPTDIADRLETEADWAEILSGLVKPI